MKNSEIKIMIASATLQPIKITTGLRQGDTLFLIILNLVLEKVVRDINISEDLVLNQSILSLLVYNEYIVILGNNMEMIKILFKKLMVAMDKVGLTN